MPPHIPAFPAPLERQQVPESLAHNPLVEALLTLTPEQEGELAQLAAQDAAEDWTIFEELRRSAD